MTDKIYPSTKPNGTNAAAPAPNQPAAKTHLHNPTRHPYRPNPASHRRLKNRNCSCRRCFCLTCFWSILILIAILLLAAIAAAAFYVLYHPHRPSFTVTSLKISSFNLTTTPSDDTTHLTTRFNLTLSARNPNSKKITFFYEPMSITVLSNSIILSNGTFTNFTSPPGGIFVIHTRMGLNSQLLDADQVNSLKSDLKRKNGLPIEIVMDTTVRVKMEKMRMKKIGIRIKCDGVHGIMPNGRAVKPAVANTDKAECNVDLRIKIWKFSF